ncbi:MAG: twin-arginine translocation signal domain-containing protein [Verrucomicrobia bacterium]|nr:twin-arginine translocation signal domain-containing protein [Verrucomicrobiota bacterium]
MDRHPKASRADCGHEPTAIPLSRPADTVAANDPPHPIPLPLRGGEGVRRTGEGAVQGWGEGRDEGAPFMDKAALSRRKFLKRGAWAAAAVGAIAIGVAGSKHASARARRAKDASHSNPFAYDLTSLRKTDPGLIHYEEAGRFPCPRLEPKRIAIDRQDQVFIASGHYISILDGQGAVVSEIALRASARAMTVADDGLVYISLRDHIEVLDAKGRRSAAWDSPAPRTWLTGLAVSENDLFAADAGHRFVLRYDRSGKIRSRIGERDRERDIPGFVVPSPYFDLKLARDGLLRITNPGRHRVEAYTIEGDFEFAWGKGSAAIEGFCGCCNPITLHVLPDGRCITCEKGLPRVKVYAPDGTFESVVAGTEGFPENAKVSAKDDADGTQGGLDAAADSQGRIYILDPVAGNVRVMVRKGTRKDAKA